MFTASLEMSIAQTLAYADVFDYPLTAAETHRYLVGLFSPLSAVQAALELAAAPGGWIQHDGLYYTLIGGSALGDTRRARALSAELLLTSAVGYGRRISRLPFVRMVAITGALAMDNVIEGADIDYLIVTQPGRLWTCRGLILLLGRLAARSGVTICPNYLISNTDRALLFPEQNLYTAHEVAQMIPLSGMEIYGELRRRNAWVLDYLPNAVGAPDFRFACSSPQLAQTTGNRTLEAVLSGFPGDRLEDWEMRRKVLKLSREMDQSPEASFGNEWCKGHFHGHEHETMKAFADRFAALDRRSGADDRKAESWGEALRTIP